MVIHGSVESVAPSLMRCSSTSPLGQKRDAMPRLITTTGLRRHCPRLRKCGLLSKLFSKRQKIWARDLQIGGRHFAGLERRLAFDGEKGCFIVNVARRRIGDKRMRAERLTARLYREEVADRNSRS